MTMFAMGAYDDETPDLEAELVAVRSQMDRQQKLTRQLTDALADQLIGTGKRDGLGRVLDEKGRRFFALRELAGYQGWIDQDGYPVLQEP